MEKNNLHNYLNDLLKNLPADWLELTTHRLDIYREKLAKTEFVEAFENLYTANNSDTAALSALPTAYDYIRLGHPLSSVLEWTIAKLNQLKPAQVISFSSKTIPLLAVLRKNLFDHKKTRILYTDVAMDAFEWEALKTVYSYDFEAKRLEKTAAIAAFDGTTILISPEDTIQAIERHPEVDFYIHTYADQGSVLLINGPQNESYISDIQHVRRRETIAMTPANCYAALQLILKQKPVAIDKKKTAQSKALVLDTIQALTATSAEALLGSSGLSIQYAIMMGLIDDAQEKYPGKSIKIIVPPNCYGGTNDQARRVAACLDQVEILDLPVDGDNDMVQRTDQVLDQVAQTDGVPFIIAEIPTNPRVEVPDLLQLKAVLSKKRKTPQGQRAIAPVFILDQTFCPNVPFLKAGGIFSTIQTIAYVSGSKFPSGGKCTAGYCVANPEAEGPLAKIKKHLQLCDNGATDLQIEILAAQMPSMTQRIAAAYENTRAFVNYIQAKLPEAKINFVSEDLAKAGFTPSVFSLDLPTKGQTPEARESYKRMLNDRLIQMMITEIPNESKYCVSYGQLKGCYWTIPATSTQGTTKEADKDYIARVSVSPDLDLERHQAVFADFVEKAGF